MLTAVTATVGLLFLMFSTGKGSVHREGLFGSLFFETHEAPGGAVNVGMGVANPTALIVIFLIFCIILALSQVTYRVLKQHRAELIKERASV